MIANRKLTKILAGRTISPPTIAADGHLHFALDDGSVMEVTPAPGYVYPAGKTGKIAKVQQDGVDLLFILADNSSIDLKTADASSSVFMRDAAGKPAYAG